MEDIDPPRDPQSSGARPAFPVNPSRRSRRPKYNARDWEARKARLKKLWVVEDRTLSEVMDILKRDNFHADINAYKRQFREWKWFKNRCKATTEATESRGRAQAVENSDRMAIAGDEGRPPVPQDEDAEGEASIETSESRAEIQAVENLDRIAIVDGDRRPLPQDENVEGEDAISRLIEDLQKNRPFFVFREHFNNPTILVAAAGISSHLEAHMGLPHHLVRRMMADFAPPPSRASSRNIGDTSFFFGVLGLVSNKLLDAQQMERFLDLVMIERITPKAFLTQVFSIKALTVDAIAEALLGHCVRSNNPTALDFLLGAGIPSSCVEGSKGWKMFRQAFGKKTLDLTTAQRLLSLCFPDPDTPERYGRSLSDLTDAFDLTEGITITQDVDLMDSLLGMGALDLDSALSQAVRWNQPGRVSMLLQSGAIVAHCKMQLYISRTDSSWTAPLKINALDYAYLKEFDAVFQLLLRASEASSFGLIYPVLAAASKGVGDLRDYILNHLRLDSGARRLETVLNAAVYWHRPQLDPAIDRLLEFGVNPISTRFTHPYHSLSTLALAIPKIDLVRRLLQAGADINDPGVIRSACLGVGNLDCLRFLVTKGMDLQAVGAIGLSAALEADNQSAVKYLLQAGADINGRSSLSQSLHGWIPPLSVAVRRNHDIVRAMLYRGANINVTGKHFEAWGWRPIHYAARYGDLEMIKLLAEHGADLSDKPAFNQETSIHGECSSVMESCSLRTTEGFWKLDELENKRDWTNEDTEIFKFLVDQRAPLNSAYVRRGGSHISHATIVHLIDSMADNDLIRFALQRGARFDGNPVRPGPRTAVEAAAGKGNLVILREFQARGADITQLGSDILGRGPDLDSWKRIAAANPFSNSRGTLTNATRSPHGSTTPCGAIKEGSRMLVPFFLSDSSNRGFTSCRLSQAVSLGQLDEVSVMLNAAAKSQVEFDWGDPDLRELTGLTKFGGHWAMGDLIDAFRFHREGREVARSG